jgi:hypothetical protein
MINLGKDGLCSFDFMELGQHFLTIVGNLKTLICLAIK